MKIKVYGIEWDTSDFTEEEELASGVCVPDLPSEVTIETDYDLDEDDILDWLSNEYGFCVEDFEGVEYEDETAEDLQLNGVCGNGTEFCVG